MSALIRLNDFLLIANQSKKLAHDMLWAIVQELDAKDCPKMTLKSISLLNMIQTVRSPLRSMYRPSDFDYKYRIDEEGNLL